MLERRVTELQINQDNRDRIPRSEIEKLKMRPEVGNKDAHTLYGVWIPAVSSYRFRAYLDQCVAIP